MDDPTIREARERIDRLDAEIVSRLQARARIAVEIGATKTASRRSAYAPDRERDVIERVRALAGDGPLTDAHLAAIYRQVISACRALEREIRVGYFGPPATFTHQAALERFGESATFVPFDTIPEVFTETQLGHVDYGVVPVENSTEGAILLTLDSLVDTDVRVCSEVVLPISMQLLSRAASREEVRTVYSIPVALAQCRGWVARNLPGCEIVDAASTARAAIMAAEDRTGAAIGPALAAAEYGLNILERDIQDLAANYTRFYVIGRTASSAPTGRDKTAILFSIRDHVGALRDVADVFARRGVNMSSIQSRPSRRRAWDYIFFVELAGHEQDAVIAEALTELKALSAYLKVLGSWPVDESATLPTAPLP
ncbi:MAG TPA: prephenate dehydratase [Chloroflexota bacterium]|nr:prephenate dehydratase [Chloroflexota bacterium]